MEQIVIPYIKEVKLEQGLPDKQYAILYIDCWSVHRSQDFRDWMKAVHPLILLIYVPATCTGILQPADVGLQRVVKHRLKAGGRQRNVSCNMNRETDTVCSQVLFAGWLAE